MSGEPEVLEPEVVEAVPMSNGRGLALREPSPEHNVAAQVQHAATQLENKWMKEREERAKWDEQDRQDAFYARLVAMLASAVVAEGAVGVAPRAAQVADKAVDYADAVMEKLKSKGYFKPRVDTAKKDT